MRNALSKSLEVTMNPKHKKEGLTPLLTFNVDIIIYIFLSKI